MKKCFALVLSLVMLLPFSFALAEKEFYQLSATTLQGEPFSFESLKGKTALFVNTASKCGFTPQYEGLQSLYQKYEDKGLVVLGFPSNQFGQQEPGSNKDIASFCKLNYGVTFPMFEKGNVKGSKKQPVYDYLMKEVSGPEIGWNFEKILVSKTGDVIKRFKSSVNPDSKELVSSIETELNK